ncbi:MAG: hypothetical protein LBC13_00290 [Clostridiales bacterium]|jgi:hypothetical protein|nr:hypothetical protein [Clostridiales bacterium]
MTGVVTAGGQFFDLCLNMGAGAVLAVLFFVTGIAGYFVKSRPFNFIADFFSVAAAGILLWHGIQYADDGAFKFYHIFGFAVGFIILNGILSIIKRAIFAKFDDVASARRQKQVGKIAFSGKSRVPENEYAKKKSISDDGKPAAKDRRGGARSIIVADVYEATDNEGDMRLVLFVRKQKTKKTKKNGGKKHKKHEGTFDISIIKQNGDAGEYVFADLRKTKRKAGKEIVSRDCNK